jgi:hypothetical protein
MSSTAKEGRKEMDNKNRDISLRLLNYSNDTSRTRHTPQQKAHTCDANGIKIQQNEQARIFNNPDLPVRYFHLLTDTKLSNNGFIFITIFFLQIIKQASSLTNELQQPLTGVMILAVRFEMLSKILNPVRKKGNLNL